MIFNNLHRNIIFIVCYLLIHSVPAYSQNTEQLGYLKLECDSVGIEIRLNDKMIGYTPLPMVPLQPGTYNIVALHPNPYIWGNLDWEHQITIIPDDTITVEPIFKTSLTIRTVPFNAEVFLNNQFQGNSPLTILLDSTANKKLLLKKEGYHDYSIDLQQLKTNCLNITLKENLQKLTLNSLEKEKLKKTKLRNKTLTYGFWGLSILTGLTTVYLKHQADEKYRSYLESGSLREMNKYYNDAKRYDRYTYLFMGILQGSFILSFYFLMKSLD